MLVATTHFLTRITPNFRSNGSFHFLLLRGICSLPRRCLFDRIYWPSGRRDTQLWVLVCIKNVITFFGPIWPLCTFVNELSRFLSFYLSRMFAHCSFPCLSFLFPRLGENSSEVGFICRCVSLPGFPCSDDSASALSSPSLPVSAATTQSRDTLSTLPSSFRIMTVSGVHYTTSKGPEAIGESFRGALCFSPVSVSMRSTLRYILPPTCRSLTILRRRAS